MGREARGNGNFYHTRRPAAAVPASNASTNEGRAPNVVWEDMIFTNGKTKDAPDLKL